MIYSTIGCGLPGFGKTYHTARLVRQAKKALVVSPYPEEDYGKVCVCMDSRDVRDYIESREAFRVAFKFPTGSHRAYYHATEALSSYLWTVHKEILFVVDEIQRCRLNPKGELPPSFYLLMDEGRHKEIQTIGVARRPVQFAPLQRSLAQKVFSFNLNSHNDVRELEDWFGDSAERVRELPPRYRMEWTVKDSAVKIYNDRNEVVQEVGREHSGNP